MKNDRDSLKLAKTQQNTYNPFLLVENVNQKNSRQPIKKKTLVTQSIDTNSSPLLDVSFVIDCLLFLRKKEFSRFDIID